MLLNQIEVLYCTVPNNKRQKLENLIIRSFQNSPNKKKRKTQKKSL